MTTSANQVIANAKTRPVFYSRKSAKAQVSLWASTVTTERAPVLIGEVNKQRCSVFLRNGAGGIFLSIVGERGANGHNLPIATGKLVTGPAAVPKMVLKLEGSDEAVWVEVSVDATTELLVKLGLNMERLEFKKAMVAKRRAAKASFLS